MVGGKNEGEVAGVTTGGAVDENVRAEAGFPQTC